MILISILILFFMLLLGCQIIITLFPLKEGLKGRRTVNESESESESGSAVYQPYNSDALSNSEIALPKQNASNIEYLNSIILGLNKSKIKSEQSINSMQTQIDVLIQQQAEYVSGIVSPDDTAPEEEE